MPSETQIASTGYSRKSGDEGWLDWWCFVRWRALLTWLALAGISVALVNLGLLRVALNAVTLLAKSLSGFFPVPSAVVGIWNCITMAVIFVWFQPLLLRLNGWRSIAWISTVALAFTLCLTAPLLSEMADKTWLLPGALGVVVIVPGMALIGYRSRPWMIVIAGALFSATFWYAASTIVTRRFGNPVFTALLAANIPYAAILLYGTVLKVNNGRAAGSP